MDDKTVQPRWARRFWLRVVMKGPNECWEWSGRRDPAGYGQFSIGYSSHRSHRLSWEIANGRNPGDLKVLHECDNPPCCNPNHLFIGTQRDNVNDKLAKGRHLVGERDGMAKLTDADVVEIKRRLHKGEPQTDLALEFNVRKQTIWKIRHGETWGHIP